VQFNLLTSRGEQSERYDCTACNCEKHECFKVKNEINARSLNLPQVTITKENWYDLVVAFEKHSGQKTIPIFPFILYNVCPRPIITDQSNLLVQTFIMLDGYGSLSYFDLDDYPARYADAVAIIRDAIASYKKHFKIE
jgi:hypothetical protein